MKVLVASFAKCGTKTLHECLEILGYTVYDYDDNYEKFDAEWKHIFAYGSTTEMFKRMYENVDAVCDLPSCYYWETIHKAFPDAKIILTMRSSEDEWVASWNRHLHTVEKNFFVTFLAMLSPTARRVRQRIRELGRIVFGCPPQSFNQFLRQPNTEIQKRRYREHNESVLQKAPKDKLLVFDLSEEWKPLCEFLGKEIPDCPFPRKNVRSAMLKTLTVHPLFARMQNEAIIALSVIALFIGAMMYYFLV